MTALKVQKLVSSCGECPHYNYYSGRAYRCAMVDQTVFDKEKVAPFCPLADYPSGIIADMEVTILALRKPLEYGFGLALLTHVAGKLKVNLHANGRGLTVPLKDRKVYLGLDYVKHVSPYPNFEITFMSGEGKFKLFPDLSPPQLHEATRPIEGGEEFWQHHRLSA